MKKNTKTVLLIGGGTGGHVSPVCSLYKKLLTKQPDLNLVVVGVGGEIEKRTYKGIKNYRIIHSGKLIRAFTFSNIKQLFLLIKGFISSYFLLKKYSPDLIFSKGGYGSLPVLKVASKLGIPYMVHESDIEMGLANKMVAKNATKIFVGFPKELYAGLDQAKLIYSGQIIDDDAPVSTIDFGQPDKKTILITGGSQGSKTINDVVKEIIDRLLPDFNIFHQTGIANFDEFTTLRKNLSAEQKARYEVIDFFSFEVMLGLIKKSDIIIGRAGATTIGEIAKSKKASILVPYKYAASDHQTKNVEYLKKIDACLVIKDDDLNPQKLLDAIYYLNDPENNKRISNNVADSIETAGLEIVSRNIIEFINKS